MKLHTSAEADFVADWNAALWKEPAHPIDYTTATISHDVKRQLPKEAEYTPEEWQKAFMNPY